MTEGQVTGVGDEATSRNGGKYRYIFFKTQDGSNVRTHIVPEDKNGRPFRNYARWVPIINAYKNNIGKTILVKGLHLVGKTVDADSPVEIKEIRDEDGGDKVVGEQPNPKIPKTGKTESQETFW